MANPLTSRAKSNIERENFVISLAAGIVLAGLVVLFLI